MLYMLANMSIQTASNLLGQHHSYNSTLPTKLKAK